MTSTPPTPLPPGIQTTILSHLLPPSIPLPQQLLSKSLLQRHLYLPPSPDDIDAWLAPLPVEGVADTLTRLAGVGWRPLPTEYASDSENTFARIRICEEGSNAGQRDTGVEVMFEWEAGGDGRGWTYLSTTTTTTVTGSTSSSSNLHWVPDPGSIPPALDEPDHHLNTNGDGHGQMGGEAVAAAGPEGYWSGFSPPASPRPDLNGEMEGGGGEDDYWASYDKAFTPAGPSAQTPARQRSPPPPADHAPSSSGCINSNGPRSGQGSAHAHEDMSAPASASASGSDQLLRSRLEMKIASMLKRIWTNYLPGTDPEYRAITFLSLARDLQLHAYTSSPNTSNGHGDGGGVRGQLEMLYEIYEVLDCKGTDADAREGFYRLVEGSLTLGTGVGGFGEGNRQDSSAQLNYWES